MKQENTESLFDGIKKEMLEKKYPSENNVPLYKVLNESRTQGNWATTESGAKSSLRIYATDHVQKTHVLDCFSFASGIKEEEAEANTAYTALAVNNLHLLAEALEEALDWLKPLIQQPMPAPVRV